MNDHSNIIGKNVARFRAAKGMSPQDLADEVNVRLFTIQSIENGRTRRSKFLPQIAKALGVELSQIDPSLGQDEETVVRETTNLPYSQSPVGNITSPFVVERTLPLHSSVEAGEGALVMSSEPVDRIDRPEILAHVRDAYAITVVGDSMEPALKPGCMVQVHPHAVPRPGDFCVFKSERDGEFRGTIKEYIGQTADHWKVKRYGPNPRAYMLSKREWPECDVVVGVLYR